MFKQKTVEGVIAQFRKNVEDLRAINDQKLAEAHDLSQEMDSLRVRREVAVAEATKAAAIAGNIEKLISA